MVESDLFEPYEKLIEIEVLGRRLRVPENNRLLRCFQFLSLKSISYGDFCWNGDCTNCQFWYREPGDSTDAPDKTALSCRFRVREGLRITRLDPCIRLEVADEYAASRVDADASAPDDAAPEDSHAGPAYQTP
ncbi:MAG TPA: hypothetical protein VM864_15115 [Pyrinomonadaceae bacterium]|jgi:hypothetical protein|nr:hypothetical protein [Pyrinomonadaceae bacterium]